MAMLRNCLKLVKNLMKSQPISSSLDQKLQVTACYKLHTSACHRKDPFKEPKKWPAYNTIVYPPQNTGDPKRPAEICHMRTKIKYSPAKLWYIAAMIRGMTIDEALKQLSFYKRKGAAVVKETEVYAYPEAGCPVCDVIVGSSVKLNKEEKQLRVLEEAQEIAVKEHNVEFKSNLWVESSFAGKSFVVKGLRKHRGPRFGVVHYRYCNYFVRLQEGKPPKHYYPPPPTGFEQMEEYLREQRQRRILYSL